MGRHPPRRGRGAQLRAFGFDCERFVQVYVGYVEDCCPPGFQHARVRSIGKPGFEGELARVPVTIDVQTQTQAHAPVTAPLHDVVWVVHRDRDWRVAAPSRLAHAASIAFADTTEGTTEPTARPDVHRLEADAARQAREALAAERRRAASYAAVGDGGHCSGGVTLSDPPTDVQTLRPPRPLPAAANLREASIAVEADDVCFSVDLEGDPRDPTWLRLRVATDNDQTPSSAGRSITVELPGDGTALIVAGEDAAGEPISAPGSVARDGRRFTVHMPRRVFEATLAGPRPGPQSAPMRLDRFVFGIGIMARTGGRLVKDSLGDFEEPNELHAYPGGERCRSVCP